MTLNVTLAPAAQKFIARMVRFSGHGASAGFRLLVTPGGCSGYNSEFTVEAAPSEGDQTVEIDGIRMFLPTESCALLDGVTIDFVDTPIKSGLTFFNPNAAPCACSSSGEVSVPTVATVGLESLRRS